MIVIGSISATLLLWRTVFILKPHGQTENTLRVISRGTPWLRPLLGPCPGRGGMDDLHLIILTGLLNFINVTNRLWDFKTTWICNNCHQSQNEGNHSGWFLAGQTATYSSCPLRFYLCSKCAAAAWPGPHLPSGWVFQQILELKKSHFKQQSSEVMLFISAVHQLFQVFLLALAMSLSLRVGGDVHRVLASGMWAHGTCHFCVEGLRTSVQPAVLHTSFHFITTAEANARRTLVGLAHWMAMMSNAQWTRNVNKKRTLAARNQWDLETIFTAA